jgi:hypothetical protein
VVDRLPPALKRLSMSRLWNRCPSGLICGMIRRRADRRRSETILLAVLFSLLVSAATLASYYKPGTSAPSAQLEEICCDQAGEWIQGFMLGELPMVEDAQMCAHLSRCRECRRAYYPRSLRYYAAFCR